MNNVFANSEEKYLKKVILYGHSDKYLYQEEAHTTKIDKDALMGLCMKGLLLVKYNDAYYTPVFFKEESGYLSVTIATNIAASASSADE